MRIRVHGGFFIPDPDPPREAHVELTTKCNLDCEFCYRKSWDEKLDFMDFDLFKKVLDELEGMGVQDVWFSGWGEPTFHPKFEEMASLASKRFNLGMVTNGTLLKYRMKAVQENFDWVFVSVDVNDPDLYRRIRVGSNFKVVDEAVRELASNGVEVWISSVLMKSTIHKLESLVDWAADVGATGILLSNLIATHPAIAGEQIPQRVPPRYATEIVFRARNRAMLRSIRFVEPFFDYRTERRCPFVEERAFAITYDGKVVPCLFTLHNYRAWIDGKQVEVKQLSFGNLKERSLKEIWWSPEYVQFRAKVKLAMFPSCNDCPFWEGCHVAESNEYDCWGNSPTCSFCPYYRGVVSCPRSYVVRWVVGA